MTKDELVERVARAIFWCQHSIMHDHEENWRAANQSLYRELAAQALRAIEEAGFAVVPKEPTEEMLRGNDDVDLSGFLDAYSAGIVWETMIDAAPKVTE